MRALLHVGVILLSRGECTCTRASWWYTGFMSTLPTRKRRNAEHVSSDELALRRALRPARLPRVPSDLEMQEYVTFWESLESKRLAKSKAKYGW